MERYLDYSGKGKHASSSMDDSMFGFTIKTDEGVIVAAGSKKRGAPEECLVRENKVGFRDDKKSFYMRAHSR